MKEDEDYWPPYGSTIAFAVYRSQEAEAAQAAQAPLEEEIENNADDLVMHISIDGEPLRSRLFGGKGDGVGAGAGAVSLSDFRFAVRNLVCNHRREDE